MDEELPTIELQGRTHQLSGSIYQSSLKGTKHYVATPRLILPVNEEQGLGPRNTTVKIVPRTMDMMENYTLIFSASWAIPTNCCGAVKSPADAKMARKDPLNLKGLGGGSSTSPHGRGLKIATWEN